MTFEAKNAKDLDIENPVNDGYDKTTEMINHNI